MALKNILLLLGTACALGGVIAGVLFALSEELAVGKISCVEGPLSDADSTNCKDGFALSATGGECNIGNLGIFNAKYDPACAVGTPYEVPALLPSFEGPTTEFPLLFPSQTNLAGIPNAPAFTTCSAYFDAAGTGAAVAGLARGITTVGLTDGVAAFHQAVKDGFDAQIASIIPTLNATLAGIAPLIISGINAEISPLALPTNYDDVILAPSTTALQFLSANAGSNAVIDLLFRAVSEAIASGFVSTNLIAAATAGFLVGVEPTFAGGLLIPNVGSFWVNVNSTVLCSGSGLGENCCMIEILEAFAPALGIDDLTSAVGIIQGYETTVGGGSLALGRGALKTGIPQADSATFTSLVQAGVNASAVEPSDIFAVVSPTTTIGTVFSAGCGSPCSYVDFMRNSSATASTAAQARGLLQILEVLDNCLAQAFGTITTTDGCISAIINSAPGGGTALKAVLGSLYGLDDDSLVTDAQVLGALAQSCQNHETDLAAIQTAAVVIPTGVGLLGAGMLLSVVAVGLGHNKLVAIGGALVAIVGMALVFAGLLGVFFAPLYSNLGGGTPVDNSIGFSLGIGFTFIAVLAALGTVGALVLLVGSLLKKPEDASVAIMKP